MIIALQAGDWGLVTVAVIVIGCVIGGMVKFVRAVGVLRRGRPEIDEELAAEQEREFQQDFEEDKK